MMVKQMPVAVNSRSIPGGPLRPPLAVAPPNSRLGPVKSKSRRDHRGEDDSRPEGGDVLVHLYLREIRPLKLLDRSEEIDLARRIRGGDAAAREQLIKANLRLVVKIAWEFHGLGLALLDLISEGNIGLMKAVDRYDPTVGAKFSTYAIWWIKQAMRRALANHSRTIRLPVHVHERLFTLARIAAKLQTALGREPTDAEIGQQAGLPERRVRHLRTAMLRPLSLDDPVGADGLRSLGETVTDERSAEPCAAHDESALLDLLREALDQLDPRERRIVVARFGLTDGVRRTLKDLGAQFGITREYVRQIQKRALEKIRQCLANRAELDGADRHG